MSNVECRLNQRFWRSKKVVQVVQIGGREVGGDVIWTKSKDEQRFFVRPSLTSTKPLDWIGLKFGDGVID